MNLNYTIPFFCLFILSSLLTAQTFTELLQSPPLRGARFSALAFADVNGDGHQDVLIAGQDNSIMGGSKLYINDGLGNFTELVNTPFDSLVAVALAFSDVNGDSYQDVLITGTESFSATERIAKLYTNDGLGNFTEVLDTPFEGLWFGTVTFADVNGNTYQDVLLTGQNSSDQRIAKLYINDGSGDFTEMIDAPFEGVRFSSVAFQDMNNDSYQDVLITGQNNEVERIAKLYTNDGLGNFTELTDTPFIGVWESAVAFSDVNSDGFPDVLITGQDSLSKGNTKLYINNSMGNFTEMMDPPFDDAWRSSIAFSDTNGDGHQDVLIAGENNLGQRISKLYLNDGLGNFTEVLDTPFDGTRFGELSFADVNGDAKEDVLITGENISGEYISKLYINDGEVSSIEEINSEQALNFSLFPNPATINRLHVRYVTAENGFVNIKLYESNGQVLSQQEEQVGLGQHIFYIDITSCSKGIYFIQLEDGKRSGFAKFVIQ